MFDGVEGGRRKEGRSVLLDLAWACSSPCLEEAFHMLGNRRGVARARTPDDVEGEWRAYT